MVSVVTMVMRDLSLRPPHISPQPNYFHCTKNAFEEAINRGPLGVYTHGKGGCPLGVYTHCKGGCPLGVYTHCKGGYPLVVYTQCKGGYPLGVYTHCKGGYPLGVYTHVKGGYPLYVYTHCKGPPGVHTHFKGHAVHVRVGWITEANNLVCPQST